MNFHEFKNLIKSNIKKLTLFPFVAGILVFLIALNFPKSFVTEGTFIIMPNFPSVKESYQEDKYDYDGYYIDQISQSYSKTVTGIIETPEFKKIISEKIKSDSNFEDLIQLSFKTNFKEIAPRVLVLSVKANSKQLSEGMFLVYEKEILNISKEFTSNKIFKLERLGNFTNTYENSISVFIYFFISYFVTFFLMVVFYYLKENKNEEN